MDGTENNAPIERKKRGFAAMDPERRREIQSAAGKKAHAVGRAHKFTSEEAREAGKKGGAARRDKLRAQE